MCKENLYSLQKNFMFCRMLGTFKKCYLKRKIDGPGHATFFLMYLILLSVYKCITIYISYQSNHRDLEAIFIGRFCEISQNFWPSSFRWSARRYQINLSSFSKFGAALDTYLSHQIKFLRCEIDLQFI